MPFLHGSSALVIIGLRSALQTISYDRTEGA